MKQSEFYALGDIANISFNPTNFGVDLSSYYRYKHMPYILEIVMPLNTTGEDADIKINESNLELLQTLKSVRNNLKVLVVMRPDFEYESQYFCKLSAVYLFDSETNTIVYDCSSCIKNTSKAKLLAEDKRQEAKNEAEWRARQKKIRHHSTPKKITCTVCFGQGYVIDSNQVRSRCWNCYGYGYTETYDY
jgi:hypothetical protein